MDVGLGVTVIGVLALAMALVIAGMLRLMGQLERVNEQSRVDLRRSMELAHSAIHNAPYRQLETLMNRMVDVLASSQERSLEAAMAISGEYLLLKKVKTEADLAAQQLLDSRAHLHRHIANARGGTAEPSDNGEISVNNFADNPAPRSSPTL